MNPTDLIDRESLRDDIPDFRPGDTLKVHVRVVEGNRERVQVFQGAAIRRQGSGIRETFAAPSCTTCVIAPARRRRSRRSATSAEMLCELVLPAPEVLATPALRAREAGDVLGKRP